MPKYSLDGIHIEVPDDEIRLLREIESSDRWRLGIANATFPLETYEGLTHLCDMGLLVFTSYATGGVWEYKLSTIGQAFVRMLGSISD